MKLSDLIKNIEYTSVSGSADIDIKAVCYDSRKASEGSVFVCITGFATDGHKYAASAVEKGAVALIAEHEIENIPENVCVLAYNKKFECARLKELAEKFPDLSKHLLNIKRNSDYGFFGKAACALYFSPSRRLSFPGISSSYRFFKQMKKLNKVLSNQPKSVFSSHFYGRFDITRLNS